MPGQKRLLELALKGLEAERQRIDEEIADIQEQIGGGGQRSRNQTARPAQTGSRLTAAGRKKLSDLMKRRWAAKKRAMRNAAGAEADELSWGLAAGQLTT